MSESRTRENRPSGSMSGERKRSVAAWPKLPRLSSTLRLDPMVRADVTGLLKLLLDECSAANATEVADE